MHPKEPKETPWEKSNQPCRNPSHDFPNMLVIPQGQSHTHTCPGCGKTITVTPQIVRM